MMNDWRIFLQNFENINLVKLVQTIFPENRGQYMTVINCLQQYYISLAKMEKKIILITLIFFTLLIENSNGWCLKNIIDTNSSNVTNIDYSPDGTMIAIARMTSFTTNNVFIYDTNTYNIKLIIPTGSAINVTALKFSPNSSLLAIGYKNGTTSILNVNQGNTVSSFDTLLGGLNSLDISSDSNYIVLCGNSSASYKSILLIYNFDNWNIQLSVAGSSSVDYCLCCEFTQDNHLLATVNNGSVLTFNPPANNQINATNITNFGSVGLTCLAYRWDSSAVYNYIVGTNGTASLVYTNANNLNSFTTAGGLTCSYSRTLDFFVFGGIDKTLKFFNGLSGNNLSILQYSYDCTVLCTDFSNDGFYLAVGLGNGSIYVYTQQCNECGASQFYEMATKTCQLCRAYIEGCAICNNYSKCSQCFESYYLNQGKCFPCFSKIPGCSTCKGSKCTSPMPGYFLNGSIPIMCETIFFGCVTCNTINCFQCYNEYYLFSGSCYPCFNLTTQCLKCASSTYCLECAIGFYPNFLTNTSQICESCSQHCIACIDWNSCLTCEIGYFVNEYSSCQLCSNGCLACNNSNYCIDCIDGTFQKDGICQSCTPPCFECNQTSCFTCILRYYLNDSSCLPCPSLCMTCNSTSSICLSCIQGYYLNSSICTSCRETFLNCQSCTNFSCNLCDMGFYNFYNNTTSSCQSCGATIPGCLICSSPNTCLFCIVSYYLSESQIGNNLCTPCPYGCSTCLNQSICLTCLPGYYYTESICNQCIGICMTCNDNSTFCLSCIIGYYLSNSNTGKCSACNFSIPGCVICFNQTQQLLNCIECSRGLYLSQANRCDVCNDSCITCIGSASNCLSCPIGYYLDNSVCKPCTEYCVSCVSNDSCLSCNIGYYLSDIKCISCLFPCITCKNDYQCISCDAGYYFISSNSTCQACNSQIQHCLFCGSFSSCLQCSYGYALSENNGSCVSCLTIADCYQCTNLTSCLTCQSGFFIKDGKCQPCSQGCIICNSSQGCLSCAPSFFYTLNTSNQWSCLRCIKQMQGCQICNSSTHCTSCISGYFKKNDLVCKLCETAITSCQMCNSQESCTKCKGGYYLDNSSLSCIQCNYALSACELCDNFGNQCTSCQTGYYINVGHCSLCGTHLAACQICSGFTTCLKCQSGYYLHSTGICDLCSSQLPGCIFCSNSVTCLTCDSGYYLDVDGCLPCSVVGCSICLQANVCVSCGSLYYLMPNSSCSLCNTNIKGCLTCTSPTNCSKCNVGYYINLVSYQCSLCTPGCSICNSQESCLQCNSMYFLNSSSCHICSVQLPGCEYCSNGLSCLACGSGFFLNSSNHCQQCTSITGCILCKNSSVCLFCDTGYYLSDSKSCDQCSIITGCYSCNSSSECISCVGGFILKDLVCEVVEVQAIQSVTNLLLKTLYVDQNTLLHNLYAVGIFFIKASLDWSTNVQLLLITSNQQQIPLAIKSVEWVSINNYTLSFYTNNPITYQLKQMPFSRRLLPSSLNLSNYQVQISLSEETAKAILPPSISPQSIKLSEILNSPQFYGSYIKEVKFHFPFYVIGAVIVAILFLKYLWKALVTVPHSSNVGNIIPHILALKVGALLLYPTYQQYSSYCYGFMYADVPFLNSFFGTLLADPRDQLPIPYSVFYTNMNIASMYLLPLCVIIGLCTIGIVVSRIYALNWNEKMKSYLMFLYNFFVFGVTFAGCASLQGVFINEPSTLNVNTAFYFLGILLYFSVAFECIYTVSQNKQLNFWKIRVFLKASLLSLSHYSPLYLLFLTVTVDFLLVISEYQLTEYPKRYPKCWIFANVMTNIALIILLFLHGIGLSLALVTVITFSVIGAEGIMHYKETLQQPEIRQENEKEWEENNIWELNSNQKNSHKNIDGSSLAALNLTNSTKFRSTHLEPTHWNIMSTIFSKNGDETINSAQNMAGTKHVRQKHSKRNMKRLKVIPMQTQTLNQTQNQALDAIQNPPFSQISNQTIQQKQIPSQNQISNKNAALGEIQNRYQNPSQKIDNADSNEEQAIAIQGIINNNQK